ncbi:redoxin domain-containing protein [Streptomyces paradoxus]|uniref:redoxin domain-containing protein n=1 Tax=Streptomyces paradoxus TaxID=66375 RepID=UPI003810574C
MRARVLATLLLTVTALTLAGCGTDTDEPASGGTPVPSGSGAAGTPSRTSDADAATAPDSLRFTGSTVDGRPFDGATLAGKPTVLWFWAPWCPKCRAQAAETAKVAEDFAGKANIVGVAGLDKPTAMKDFVASTKVDGFPNLSDEPGEIWRKFEISEQSTYVLLDKDGKTVFTGNLPAGKGLADKVGELIG